MFVGAEFFSRTRPVNVASTTTPVDSVTDAITATGVFTSRVLTVKPILQGAAVTVPNSTDAAPSTLRKNCTRVMVTPAAGTTSTKLVR